MSSKKAKYQIIKNLGRFAVIRLPNGFYGVLDLKPNDSFLNKPDLIGAGMKQFRAEEMAELMQKREHKLI